MRGHRLAVTLVLAPAVLLAGCGGAGGVAADQPERAAPTAAASTPGTPAPTSAPRTPKAEPTPRQTRVPPLTRSVPERVSIPAIGVDSDLMALGLKSDGSLETPPGAFPAGWFTGAPTPGELGPAIIVGHVRFVTPGVFERLADLQPGDKVFVARADGRTATFAVDRVQHVSKSRFPTEEVYGDLDHAGLRLITCGGLDETTDTFEDNVVVYADMIPNA